MAERVNRECFSSQVWWVAHLWWSSLSWSHRKLREEAQHHWPTSQTQELGDAEWEQEQHDPSPGAAANHGEALMGVGGVCVWGGDHVSSGECGVSVLIKCGGGMLMQLGVWCLCVT